MRIKRDNGNASGAGNGSSGAGISPLAVKSRTQQAIEQVVVALQESGQDRWTTSQVLKVINHLGLPPWKCLNRMSGPGAELKYVGADRVNGYWVLNNLAARPASGDTEAGSSRSPLTGRAVSNKGTKMKTKFESGDLVVARVTAQGMVKGETYQVNHVTELDMGVLGVFTTYYLRRPTTPVGPTFAVGNGHLLLELEDEAEDQPQNEDEQADMDAIHQGIADDESELQMREQPGHWNQS